MARFFRDTVYIVKKLTTDVHLQLAYISIVVDWKLDDEVSVSRHVRVTHQGVRCADCNDARKLSTDGVVQPCRSCDVG